MANLLCLFFMVITINLCSGNSSNNDPTRIVGGTTAQEQQFPYVVSIQEISQLALATKGHSCSGALVTFQHVVTAATCLYNYNAIQGAYVLKTPASYRVFAGSVSLANDTNADRIRAITSFNVHPSYLGPPSNIDDIGVIVLATAFPNNTGLQVLPLATSVPIDFTECVVTGWGSSNPATAATANTVLQYAYKYVYNQALCASILNAETSTPNVMPSMICAATYNIQVVSCYNDTGNPLVCNGVLTGVLSWYPPCVATTWPELYTRVSNYTTWVRSVTGSAPGTSSVTAVVLVSAILVQIMNFIIQS